MARRSKGEGTLYQAKDKSWIYQYKVDGARKTKRFQRKSDAKAFMDSLSTAAASAPAFAPAAPVQASTQVLTVGEWMDRWLEAYAKPTIKLSTYVSYEQYIRTHIKPNLGTKYLNTLRVDELQDFFNERSRSGNAARKG